MVSTGEPRDDVIIVEALAVWDKWRGIDDSRADRARELSEAISLANGFERSSEFVWKATQREF